LIRAFAEVTGSGRSSASTGPGGGGDPPPGSRTQRLAANPPSAGRAHTRHVGDDLGRLGGGLRLDVAGDLAAALDLDLAVADRPGDAAAGLDQEPLADHQIALEAALDLGLLDRGRAFEQTALGNLDVAAVVQIGLDAAFDDQLVAGGDL